MKLLLIRFISTFFICNFLIILFPSPASSETINIEQLKDEISIGKKLTYLEDKSGKLTLKDILSDKFDNKWKRSNKENLRIGFTKSAYWVRFTISNNQNNIINFYLLDRYPLTDHIELYIPDKNNAFKKIINGDTLPFSKRPYQYKSFLFDLKLLSNEQKTYFIRYHTSSVLNIELSIYSKNAFHSFEKNEAIILWIIYTILLLMSLYNFILFVFTRDLSYIFYVIFNFSMLLFFMTLDGTAFQYLWPNYVWWAGNCLPLFQGLITFSVSQFIRYFIRIQEKFPINDRILHYFSLLGILQIIITLIINNYNLAIQIGALLTFLLTIYSFFLTTWLSLFVKMDEKYNYIIRHSQFFILSFTIFLLGVVVYVLMIFKVIPVTLLFKYMMHVGCAGQTILLSFGLADRINTMRKKLKIMNANLEQNVAERTEKLQVALRELESSNKKLMITKEALWSEMEMAKKIQTLLLPKEPSIPGFEISAFMEPAVEVGGDYYDIINRDESNWITIGDVSGHGVPAGLIMMMVQTCIRSHIYTQPEIAPSELLKIVNITISHNIEMMSENKFMTISVFCILNDGRIIFSGRHEDILIYRKNQQLVETIKTDGICISPFLLGKEDINNELKLESGDVLLLYTDGITEAFKKGNEATTRNDHEYMFGTDGLVSILKEFSEGTSYEIKDAILKGIEDFEKNDDITLIVMKKI